jgi:hypothetical protein
LAVVSAKPPLFLHIGTHRTGTTSVQWFCDANRRALAKAGIYYPSFAIGGYHTHYAHHALAHATAGDTSQMDLRDVKRFLLLVRRRMRRGQACLISAEPYYRHRLPTADGRPSFGRYIELVAETFADFEVTVLAMVRRQDLFLESLYAEHVMATDYPGTIGDFAGSHHGILDYRGRLDAWSQAFGRQSVRVLPYEPSLLDRPLEQAFLEWLGIEWSDAFHIDADRRNARLTRACVEFKRMANVRGEFDPDANAVLRGWIEDLGHDDAGVAPPDLGEYYLAPADRVELMAGFADDNRVVAREYLGREELFTLPIEADIENYPGDLRLSDADALAMAQVLLRRLSKRQAEPSRPR